MNYSLLLDLLQSGDYERLLRSRTYKQYVCHKLRAPLLRSHIKNQTIFTHAEENTGLAGFLPRTILNDEKQYLKGEGILLVKGRYPRWSQKQAAAKQECVILGRDMYIQLRDIIVSLFYLSPKNYLTLDRLFQFIRSEHFAETSVVYHFLNRYGYINFGLTSSEEIDQPTNQHKARTILVVGAGTAGLAASQQLCKFGFDVIVIEARTRIGGRVQTLQLQKDQACSIDLGISFSVGKDGNPLYLLAQQKSLPIFDLPSEVPLFSSHGVIHYQIETDVEKQFHKLLNSMSENQDSIIQNNNTKDMSTREALESLRNFAISAPSGEGENQEQVQRIFQSALNWHEANMEHEYSAPLENLSFRCWEREDDLQLSGPAWFPVSGFSSLLGGMTSHLLVSTNPSRRRRGGSIFFDTVATSVTTLGDTVTVRSTNGNEFSADAALITVPLGVLKKRSIMFTPALPEWKQSAIDRLGVGLESKVILYFEEAFWPTHMPVFGNCVMDAARKGEHFLFINLFETTKQPILVALTTGSAAHEAEKKTDEQLVDSAIEALKQMFDPSRVLSPRYCIRTSWKSDPFAEGNSSYLPVGASLEDLNLLGQPIANRLFFAGEAMTRQYSCSMAGSTISGIRNAGRISRLYSRTRSAFELQKKHEMAHLLVTLQNHFFNTSLRPPVRCYRVPQATTHDHDRPSLSLKDLVRAATASEYRYLNPLVVATLGGRREEDTRKITLFKRDATPSSPPPDEEIMLTEEKSFSDSEATSETVNILPSGWDTEPLTQQMLDCVTKELNRNKLQNGISSQAIAHELVKAFLRHQIREFGPCDFSESTINTSQRLRLQMLVSNVISDGVLDPSTLAEFPVTNRPPTKSIIN